MSIVEIETKGLEDAVIHFDDYGDHLGNWDEFWPALVESFARQEEVWFDTEGKGSWPPLSSKYAAWKAVHYPGRPILVANEDLRDSLTDPALVKLFSDPNSLMLGTSVSYAIYHHSRAPRTQLPRRAVWPPIVQVTASFARQLVEWVRYKRGRRGPLGL